MIFESKRYRRKTAQELRAEPNVSRQKPVSVSTVKNQVESTDLRWEVGRNHEETPVIEGGNKMKKLLWLKKKKKLNISRVTKGIVDG